MDMYVWKVRVEIEYEACWKEDNGIKTEDWTDTEDFTVAAPSGIAAIEKAKQIGKDFQEPWDNSMEREEGEPLKAYRIAGISDVTHLELLQELDG